jgi:ribose transport system substrate-binding protein
VANETIAVFTKNRSNPAYDAARLGAERTAARNGARVVHYVPRKPDDIAEQIALVERAIAARPDAVVFVPVHLTELDASVRELNAAGIPVVNYLNRLAHGRFVSYVGSDDYRLARDIAAYLFRHMDGKGDVLLIEGVPGAVTSRERVRGFLDAVKEWPGMRIVATRTGQFLEDAGREAMRAVLAEGIRFDGVLSANDAMALGALSALEAAGIRVPVIGVNALPDAIESVKTGRLLATVDFDALKIACVATEAALRHLRGQPVPAEIMLPVQVVNRTNCQPWDRPLEERECPRWEDVVR